MFLRRFTTRLTVVGTVGVLAVSLAACGGGGANSATSDGGGQKTLVLLGPAGPWADTYNQVLPEFTKETGIKVTYIPGESSTKNVARLIAERNNPQVDVVDTNDVGLIQGEQANIFATLDPKKIPNYADTYPQFRQQGDKLLGIPRYITTAGLEYNPDLVSKAHQQPPTSWFDLWNPAYKGKVGMTDCSNVQCYGLVPLLAKLQSGDPTNLNAAFDKLKQLAPNLKTIATSSTGLDQLMTQGNLAVSTALSYAAYTLKAGGVNVEFATPKEGAFYYTGFLGVAEGSSKIPEAEKLLDYMLSPTVQAAFAKNNYASPVNTKVKLDSDVASKVTYGQEQVDALQKIDWAWVEKNLQTISDKFNSEVAQ